MQNSGALESLRTDQRVVVKARARRRPQGFRRERDGRDRAGACRCTPTPSRVPGVRCAGSRPVAGFAVAAGVAAVAVLTMQQGRQVGPGASSPTTPADIAPLAVFDRPTPSRATRCRRPRSPSAFVPAARLTNYVVAHSEYSSPLGRRTVLSGVLSEDDDHLGTDEPIDDASDVETQVTTP